MQEQSKKKTKEEFLSELQALLSESLGEEYCVQTHSTEKINGVRKEMLLIRRNGYACAPSFYADELYQSYLDGTPVLLTAEQLSNVVQKETEKRQGIVDEICTREWMEEHLFLRLVNYEANKELLETSVYVRILDLAAVFCVVADQEEDMMRSYRVQRLLWEKNGFGDPEEMYEAVLLNTKRLFPESRITLVDFFMECFQKRGIEPKEDFLKQFQGDVPFLLILTNLLKVNGAAVVLYPGFLSEIAEELGSFYIVPSSIHEVMIVEEDAGFQKEEINAMIREINMTQVEPEEVLSDHLYYYSAETGLCIR